MPEVIPGTSFFPGGRGVWYEDSIHEAPPFPLNGIMVLGHYFYSESGYRRILARGKDGNAHPSDANTWNGLQPFFDHLLEPRRCFFTNFFMRLSLGAKEGVFPGSKSRCFVRRCQNFLRLQLSAQKPRVLLVLGKHVLPFLAEVAPALQPWGRAKTFKQIDAEGCAVVHAVSVPNCDCPDFSAVALVHPSRRSGTVGGRQFGSLFGGAAELEMVRSALARSGIRAV